MASTKHVAIPGSERQPMPGAVKSRPCDPSEMVQVTVVLRARPLGRNVKPLDELVASGERVTRDEYAARYGADPEDVKRVEEFARTSELTVTDIDMGARTVKLQGTAEASGKAFQVELGHYQWPE